MTTALLDLKDPNISRSFPFTTFLCCTFRPFAKANLLSYWVDMFLCIYCFLVRYSKEDAINVFWLAVSRFLCNQALTLLYASQSLLQVFKDPHIFLPSKSSHESQMILALKRGATSSQLARAARKTDQDLMPLLMTSWRLAEPGARYSQAMSSWLYRPLCCGISFRSQHLCRVWNAPDPAVLRLWANLLLEGLSSCWRPCFFLPWPKDT